MAFHILPGDPRQPFKQFAGNVKSLEESGIWTSFTFIDRRPQKIGQLGHANQRQAQPFCLMKREAPDNAPAGCHFGDFELSAGSSFEPPVFMKNGGRQRIDPRPAFTMFVLALSSRLRGRLQCLLFLDYFAIACDFMHTPNSFFSHAADGILRTARDYLHEPPYLEHSLWLQHPYR